MILDSEQKLPLSKKSYEIAAQTWALGQKFAQVYIILDQADSKRYLSFAWLVWDILTEIRREKIFAQKNFTISWDPLSNRLSQHINEFILESNSNHNRVRRFMKRVKEEVACLGDYIKKHLGTLLN